MTTGLIHGWQPDVLILCHDPLRKQLRWVEGYPAPPLEDAVALNLTIARLTNPGVRVAGISFNTSSMSEEQRQDVLGETAARVQLPCFDPLKSPLDADGVLPAIEAVRRNAPGARLVIDANQSWSLRALTELAPELERLRVDLIERSLPVDGGDALAEYRGAVPLCAYESFNDRSDIARLAGCYAFVSTKLNKTGGLTAALDLAARARAAGLRLMIGCMIGSSLAIAPAMVLAQRCEVADLDGPLLQAVDCDHGVVYDRGLMTPPSALLWG